MFRIVTLCLFFISLPGEVVADVFRIEFLTVRIAALTNTHDIKLPPDAKWLFVSDVDNGRVAIFNGHSLALLGDFNADHQDGTHYVDFD